MDPISTLLMIAFLGACTHIDNMCKKEQAKRERELMRNNDTSDQGWGSFDPGDGDYGDGSDYGGF